MDYSSALPNSHHSCEQPSREMSFRGLIHSERTELIVLANRQQSHNQKKVFLCKQYLRFPEVKGGGGGSRPFLTSLQIYQFMQQLNLVLLIQKGLASIKSPEIRLVV